MLFSGEMQKILMILCAGCIYVASAKLLVLPQNAVVMSGQQTKLECQTNGTETRILWQRDLLSASQQEKIVSSGYNISPYVASFCKLSTDSVGEFSLQIYGLDDAAQRYICIEPGTLENGSAELVVLESDPICVDHSDNDFIDATCTIVFHGNWFPQMHWKLNDSDIHGNHVTEVHLNDSLTSRLKLPRNMTSYSISCKTNFSLHLKPRMTTAKNIPPYTSEWRSGAPAVLASANPDIVAMAICCPLAILLLCGTVIFLYRCYKNSHNDGGDQAEYHSCTRSG